jgi:serine/threonine-protein kinase
VGRDVNDVEKELKGLGLKVDRNELDNPGTAQPDTVESVDPDGELQKGATVTVGYYGSPSPSPSPSAPVSPLSSGPGHSGDSHGKGNGAGR